MENKKRKEILGLLTDVQIAITAGGELQDVLVGMLQYVRNTIEADKNGKCR